MTSADHILQHQLEINLRKTERDMALEKVGRLEEVIEKIQDHSQTSGHRRGKVGVDQGSPGSALIEDEGISGLTWSGSTTYPLAALSEKPEAPPTNM